MKVTNFTTVLKFGLISAFWLAPASVAQIEEGTGNMVKMCLFYGSPSGHARTDPIITDTDLSDHVHTFYGPLNFHPKTSNDDLRNTSSSLSTSPFVENQSLYWVSETYISNIVCLLHISFSQTLDFCSTLVSTRRLEMHLQLIQELATSKRAHTIVGIIVLLIQKLFQKTFV